MDKWQQLEEGMGEATSMMHDAYASWSPREQETFKLGLHLAHWEEAAAVMDVPRATAHLHSSIALLRGLAP